MDKWLRVLGLAAGMAVVMVPACDDEAPSNIGHSTTGDAGSVHDGGVGNGGGDGGKLSIDAPATQVASIDCFKGTPKTNQEFLDACWPDTVAAVAKSPRLPASYVQGTALPGPAQ